MPLLAGLQTRKSLGATSREEWARTAACDHLARHLELFGWGVPSLDVQSRTAGM